MKTFLVMCLFMSSAFAGDPSSETKFLVRPTSPEVDAGSLAAPNVKVLPLAKRGFASSLPSVDERDGVFKRSGVKGVESWDDFDKDSLYLKLSKPGPAVIDRILKKYPQLNRESLERAQLLINGQGE